MLLQLFFCIIPSFYGLREVVEVLWQLYRSLITLLVCAFLKITGLLSGGQRLNLFHKFLEV